MLTAEQQRLNDTRQEKFAWKKWGPYLSERQWGTVREDYSEGGDAWDYFTHDQARSRAYRWGEDGIAGVSDDKQHLCFALAVWNGKDPILKERLFGLTNSEGNHGEDVKEYYFYLDSTPTHSYMKYLYKYPQAAYPYSNLVDTSRGRSRRDFEYELLDTGVFDDDRYFDVFVEYAKASPEDKTNTQRLAGVPNRTPYVKDGINNYLLHARQDAVNPEKTGTKASVHYTLELPAGGSRTVRLRLTDAAPATNGLGTAFGEAFDGVMAARRGEADEFYASVIPSSLDKDAANVMRQALAGMLWSKQFFHYDVDTWLSE